MSALPKILGDAVPLQGAAALPRVGLPKGSGIARLVPSQAWLRQIPKLPILLKWQRLRPQGCGLMPVYPDLIGPLALKQLGREYLKQGISATL